MSNIQFINMMEAELESAPGTEVILSHVVLPPRFALPRHWHPGEEFAYIMKGSVTLWQEGEGDRTVRAGETVKVPHKVVHTVRTGDQGVTLIVFRVHEKGQPERVLVEDTAAA